MTDSPYFPGFGNNPPQGLRRDPGRDCGQPELEKAWPGFLPISSGRAAGAEAWAAFGAVKKINGSGRKKEGEGGWAGCTSSFTAASALPAPRPAPTQDRHQELVYPRLNGSGRRSAGLGRSPCVVTPLSTLTGEQSQHTLRELLAVPRTPSAAEVSYHMVGSGLSQGLPEFLTQGSWLSFCGEETPPLPAPHHLQTLLPKWS